MNKAQIRRTVIEINKRIRKGDYVYSIDYPFNIRAKKIHGGYRRVSIVDPDGRYHKVSIGFVINGESKHISVF